MTYTGKKQKTSSNLGKVAICAVRAANRPQLIQQLYKKSIGQLISEFLIEMDEKNKAYFFILEHGHFDAFKNYCQTKKTK